MDPTSLTLIIGAALATVPAVLGFVAGHASGRARERRIAQRPPQLICSCHHGYGSHDNEQRCYGVDKRRLNGMQLLDPCPCRHYDGPEPLPRAWTPLTLPVPDDRT